MNMNQNNKDTPLFKISNWYLYIKNRKIHLLTLLILLLAGRFIYGASEKTIENYRVANNGDLSKGIVTSRMEVGAKGTINIEYKFQANDAEYIGHTTNENYEIGDSIYVLYLSSNPSINRSYTFIKENYKTKITPQMKLLIWILLAANLTCCAQTFEGKIVQSNRYKSKLANLKDEQLNSMMGTKQEYYIKSNNYKSVFNGKFVKLQIYKGDENRSYTLTAKTDTLYREDYVKNREPAVSFEIEKNKGTVMSIPCDVIIVNTFKSKTYYYYNSMYAVDPSLYSKHTYGNWYYIISKIKALALKTVYETEQFVLTSTAVEITPMELAEELFGIVDTNKVATATWQLGRSFVQGGDEGEWRGSGRNGLSLSQDNPAPHEFGHLMGLGDRYTDAKGTNPGWKGNIMGEATTEKVEQRNINGMIGEAMKAYEKFQADKNNANKPFNYEIDIYNPDKKRSKGYVS